MQIIFTHKKRIIYEFFCENFLKALFGKLTVILRESVNLHLFPPDFFSLLDSAKKIKHKT